MLDYAAAPSFCLADVSETPGMALPTVSELEGWRADLQALVDGLNAAPERIATGLKVADLEDFGVPQDLLARIRADVVSGGAEEETVLRFLELVAKSPLGGALTKAVKRAIRAALRRHGGDGGRRDPLRWLKRAGRRP
jgi:hypothetical protein